jgi:pyrroline-5-carboxylate reductase
MNTPPIAFIGGGNMASALIGGCWSRPGPAGRVHPRGRAVREHSATSLRQQPSASLALPAARRRAARGRHVVVWAVKPQTFAEQAAPAGRPYIGGRCSCQVMAGIRSDAIAQASGTERVVRAMPNTPALIGRGIAGLVRARAVGAAERAQVERCSRPPAAAVGRAEADLDAVTAVSGSGPAYVFYVIEAMTEAGVGWAWRPDAARRAGAGHPRRRGRAGDALGRLRRPRCASSVTSKGGTTHAAITVAGRRGHEGDRRAGAAGGARPG